MNHRSNIPIRYAVLIRCALPIILICVTGACRSSRLGQYTNKHRIQTDTSGYWMYNDQKTLLLGAFNHGHNPFIDGSTLDDRQVDSMEEIISQMDEMVAAGGNTLRCVLDPGMAADAGIESYKRDESGKYNLTIPEGPYWERLTTFIAEAEKRDIIVELEIWDRFDWQGTSWTASPFNPQNNSNYTIVASGLKTAYERHVIYRHHPFSKGVPGHPAYEEAMAERKVLFDTVRKYQEIFVNKVLDCAFPYSNVLYNMNNETSEPSPWGEYWIRLVKEEADKAGINVPCTDMSDAAFKVPESREVNYQLAHPEIFDYLDVSQVNSRLRDEGHWNKIKWITDQAKRGNRVIHMTKLYGSDHYEPGPWKGFRPGDSDNAIEEWWRNLVAGVAGVRFHRPDAGLGLSAKTKACIMATRKVESRVKFWDVEPTLELLYERGPDEAYLAANPGIAYILYMTHHGGGAVKLDLLKYSDTLFLLEWINIDTGDWGPSQEIIGGKLIPIVRPEETAHWVAVLQRKKH